MKSLSNVFTTLREKSRGQYLLLFGCLFFSVLLITAYCLMMRSPTVLNVLPVGGDSRKQVMMIFVLAVIGCGAFTLYAAGLFFRHKSREMGVFLALGASRRILARQLRREVGLISVLACAVGMVLGTPLAWLVWSIFRLTLMDTPEMALLFDFRAYAIPAAFSVFVIVALLVMLARFFRRVNILDIISETHRAEPIRAVPRWFGAVGIALVVLGALLGYFVPSFCVLQLHWYPPEGLTAIFYLPALIGLYMLLLHTVVNGWKKGKSRYSHLIATGMMQFQGRQTVRNMLVITVLVAGAYFAAFYSPMLATTAQLGIAERTEDYAFFYPTGVNMPDQTEIERLAEQNDVTIKEYRCQESAMLAVDGELHVETESSVGITYTKEYQPMLESGRFFSESSWNALTGDSLDLAPGEVAGVFNFEGYGGGIFDNDISLITNPVTKQTLSVIPSETILKNDTLFSCRVLDDEDYAAITQGLTGAWRAEQVLFHADNDSYAFAKSLFNEIVDRANEDMAVISAYDPVRRDLYHARGDEYFADPENADKFDIPVIDYAQPDSSAFRQNWMYMPQFRILDQADFATNMAVFLLLFIFVAILCFTAVGVILFTRSMTLAITNAWVYADLRKLGASNAYLRQTARGQISRVFKAPIVVGTLLIFGFYTLILYGNGEGGITPSEWASLGSCLFVVAAVSVLLYALYRVTLRSAYKELGCLKSERINSFDSKKRSILFL
ncbi:MAG: ABC transporter permease [bacterium]|nr:ABC transporter permease [bacterium]